MTTTPRSLGGPRRLPLLSLLPLLLGEGLGLMAAASMQLATAWWIGSEGGAAHLARYGVLTAAAALLVTPLLSPAGDRWPKRRLIRLGRLVLVLDALLLTGLGHAGLYDLGLLCGCGLLSVMAMALLGPVEASILPELVDTIGLPAAMRQRRAAQALGGLLGPAAGGAVLAGAGLPHTMACNLALCLLAAVASAWLPATATSAADAAATAARSATTTASTAATSTPRSRWLTEISSGLRAKWQVRLDRWWTAVGALMMLCLAPAIGLLLPLRIQAAGASPAWLGACSAALSGGVLLGLAGLAPSLIDHLGRIRALAVVVGAIALALLGIGLCTDVAMLVALFTLIGLCMSVTQMVGQTHRLLAMPEHYRARMNAAHLMVAHLAGAAAPALAGALLQCTSVATAYLLLAIGFGASGLLLLAVPGLGPFLRQDHDGARGWYARHYPQAFRPR